jgi:AbiV family abortive infection protein
MEKMNLNKINHLAATALKNGIHIHFDSIYLYNKKSYSTSYFFAVLALEEIGKAFQIDNFWWHSTIDGRMDPEMELKWMKIIYDHKKKQQMYAYSFGYLIDNKDLMNDIKNGSIELLKQNSIYVGIGEERLKSKFSDKINNPLKMTSVKPKQLITLTNTKMLEFCLLQLKGYGGFDSPIMARVLNEDLYYQLKREWSYISEEYKPRIKELENLVVSVD